LDSDTLWAALALMLVLEGLLPLLWPSGWRAMFSRLMALRDGQVRFFALCNVAIGVLLLWLLG